MKTQVDEIQQRWAKYQYNHSIWAYLPGVTFGAFMLLSPLLILLLPEILL